MAGNKKISQLTDGGAGQSGDKFVIERGGVNFSIDYDVLDPGGISVSGTVNDMIVVDEKGDVALEKRQSLPAAISFVDNTAVPPSETDGDIYLLDDTGASNAAWDGALPNSWVRYDGSAALWREIQALDGYICTLQDTGNTRVFNPTTSTWNLLGGAPAGANTEIQYNDSGSFGASSLFTFDAAFGTFSCDAAAVFNEGGTDQDFRIEALTEPNMFFVDADANSIGIGTNTPSAFVEFRDDSDAAMMRMGNIAVSGPGLVDFALEFKNGSGVSYQNALFAYRTGAGDDNIGLRTRRDIEFWGNTTLDVIFREKSPQGFFVGIGLTNPVHKLHVVSSSQTSTNSAGFFSNTNTGGNDYTGVYGESTGANAGDNIGGHFTASGGSNNYGLLVENGNAGIGTTAPSSQALLELVSTSQAFLIMRMTAAQASAITPADGMGLYATDTNGTFTSVGFWKYESGAWATW